MHLPCADLHITDHFPLYNPASYPERRFSTPSSPDLRGGSQAWHYNPRHPSFLASNIPTISQPRRLLHQTQNGKPARCLDLPTRLPRNGPVWLLASGCTVTRSSCDKMGTVLRPICKARLGPVVLQVLEIRSLIFTSSHHRSFALSIVQWLLPKKTLSTSRRQQTLSLARRWTVRARLSTMTQSTPTLSSERSSTVWTAVLSQLLASYT